MPKIARSFSLDDYISFWISSKENPSDYVNKLLIRMYDMEKGRGFRTIDEVKIFREQLREKVALIEEDIKSTLILEEQFRKKDKGK